MVTYMRKGDLRPPLQATLKYSDGTTVVLTGCTVTFSMKDVKTDTLKINKAAATIVDAANGIVQYAWSGTNTDTEGEYKAQFEVTFSDTKTQKFPSMGELLISIGESVS